MFVVRGGKCCKIQCQCYNSTKLLSPLEKTLTSAAGAGGW